LAAVAQVLLRRGHSARRPRCWRCSREVWTVRYLQTDLDAAAALGEAPECWPMSEPPSLPRCTWSPGERRRSGSSSRTSRAYPTIGHAHT